MLYRNYLLILALFGSITLTAQKASDSITWRSCSESTYNQYLPVAHAACEIVRHEGYTLGYSEAHEQAAWVCYVLSNTECAGGEERASSFYVDKAVTTGSANDADYKSSGYDRGHLAPAGDMGFSESTMKESFFYSNMSPQVPRFNRGIWKKLEAQVRTWGSLYGSILVLTGPVLSDSLPTIGPNKVAIPESYYKIIVNAAVKPPQAIGFILKNEPSSKKLSSFVVTIDDIEALTGLDFLSAIPATDQRALENHVDGTYWKGFEKVRIAPPANTSQRN